MNEMSRQEIVELGEALEANGVVAHRPALTRLALMALARGVTPAAAGVLLDDAAPEVVQLRAYAVAARAIAATDRTPQLQPPEPVAA